MPTSLATSARLAGAHRWAEARLFEIVGGWVPSTSEPQVKLLFDRHSQHHAWRASQWFDRLPVLADLDREALSAPVAGAADAFDLLASLATPVARMAGVYRVALPRMWAAYERHRAQADPVADAATLRTLALVARDLAADWHEGEAALQALVGEPVVAREAAEAALAVEELLAAGGGAEL
ncbi:MAG TPA: hypothetical protein VKU88_02450 [Acidimicrobiales bacterium]|nr:hypothetical protein [Acidimicrobiales bacterium]